MSRPEALVISADYLPIVHPTVESVWRGPSELPAKWPRDGVEPVPRIRVFATAFLPLRSQRPKACSGLPR